MPEKDRQSWSTKLIDWFKIDWLIGPFGQIASILFILHCGEYTPGIKNWLILIFAKKRKGMILKWFWSYLVKNLFWCFQVYQACDWHESKWNNAVCCILIICNALSGVVWVHFSRDPGHCLKYFDPGLFQTMAAALSIPVRLFIRN